MSREKLSRMLRSTDMGASHTFGINGILARMWKKILFDNGMSLMVWNKLMVAYIRDHKNNIPDNKRDQSSVQGNLTKELIKNSMTWKIFCKGLRFLRLIKFDLTVTAYHRDGKVTVHTIPVELYNGEQHEE